MSWQPDCAIHDEWTVGSRPWSSSLGSVGHTYGRPIARYPAREGVPEPTCRHPRLAPGWYGSDRRGVPSAQMPSRMWGRGCARLSQFTRGADRLDFLGPTRVRAGGARAHSSELVHSRHVGLAPHPQRQLARGAIILLSHHRPHAIWVLHVE